MYGIINSFLKYFCCQIRRRKIFWNILFSKEIVKLIRTNVWRNKVDFMSLKLSYTIGNVTFLHQLFSILISSFFTSQMYVLRIYEKTYLFVYLKLLITAAYIYIYVCVCATSFRLRWLYIHNEIPRIVLQFPDLYYPAQKIYCNFLYPVTLIYKKTILTFTSKVS